MVGDPAGAATTQKVTVQSLLELAYPVGAIYISVDSASPATLFGGTWSAFAAGRVLVGLDAGQAEFDTAEEVGGAKTHTLSEAEMPSHTHVQSSHNHGQLNHSHTIGHVRSATTGAATSHIARTSDTSSTLGVDVTTDATMATNVATTAINQSTGGGGAHNNLQPYVTVYMWKRTA